MNMIDMDGFTREISGRVTRYITNYHPNFTGEVDFSTALVSIRLDDAGAWETDMQTVVNIAMPVTDANGETIHIDINIPYNDIDFLVDDILTQAMRGAA